MSTAHSGSSDRRQQLQAAVKKRRGQLMPTPSQIVAEAQISLKSTHSDILRNKQSISENLDQLIYELLNQEYELFKEHQQRVGVTMLSEYLQGAEWADSQDIRDHLDVQAYTVAAFSDIDQIFLSFAQARRARAGNSFERHLAYLLNLLELPFQEQQVINGKPDFLLPNAQLYRDNPSDVVLISVKRTLRERWRQIIIEGVKTSRYFLATIDENQSKDALDEMAQNRVFLVVPQAIIDTKPLYIAAKNVISFNDLYRTFVVPASKRWS